MPIKSITSIAGGEGSFPKVIQHYKRPALLIFDAWLLYSLKETEARDLLEIIEARHKVASTIFCSQFSVRGSQDKIGDSILADAICDRIVHDSYTLVVEGKESIRNLYCTHQTGAPPALHYPPIRVKNNPVVALYANIFC